MHPSLDGLSPEQKRAMLARLLQKSPTYGPPALIQGAVVLATLETPNVCWNICSTLRLLRKPDPEMLRARLQRIVDRHPALRTTYEVDVRVMARVHEGHQVVFEVVDASTWTPEVLRARLLSDACVMYKLSELPLFRVRLYQRQNDDILQIEMHHNAADLWSMEIIQEELETPPEGPPPPSFMEFCAWQQAWIKGPQAQKDARWWYKTLQGAKDLTFGQAREEDTADRITFEVDPDLLASIRASCRTHRITLFNLLLTAVQVTLARMRGVDDFCIVSAAANRPDPRFEKTVGFFANPLMYRIQLGPRPTWLKLWDQNRTMIAGVLDRQFFPLLQALEHPLTDVLFMFQQYQKARWIPDAPPGETLGLRSGGLVDSPLGPREYLYVELPTLAAAVMFEVIEQKDRLVGIMRFRQTTLTRPQAEAVVQGFLDRLHSAVADPNESALG